MVVYGGGVDVGSMQQICCVYCILLLCVETYEGVVESHGDVRAAISSGKLAASFQVQGEMAGLSEASCFSCDR